MHGHLNVKHYFGFDYEIPFNFCSILIYFYTERYEYTVACLRILTWEFL